MARYIDADALLEKLKKLREFWGFTFTADGVDEAIDEVEEAPDADVAPKSEVAREIFGEIDVCLEKFINDISYSSGDLIYDIGELKEKYTEDKENGKS